MMNFRALKFVPAINSTSKYHVSHYTYHIIEVYLCSGEVLLSLKLQSDGVIGRKVHGVDDSDGSSQFVQSICNEIFTHTDSSTHLILG